MSVPAPGDHRVDLASLGRPVKRQGQRGQNDLFQRARAENARLKRCWWPTRPCDIDMLKEISSETLTPNRGKRSAVVALRERFRVSSAAPARWSFCTARRSNG